MVEYGRKVGCREIQIPVSSSVGLIIVGRMEHQFWLFYMKTAVGQVCQTVCEECRSAGEGGKMNSDLTKSKN